MKANSTQIKRSVKIEHGLDRKELGDSYCSFAAYFQIHHESDTHAETPKIGLKPLNWPGSMFICAVEAVVEVEHNTSWYKLFMSC